MRIENGNKVKLDYEGRFEDGTIFDTSKHGDHSHPLEFTVGQNQVIPGFEKGLIGLEEGNEKEIFINSKDAYGARNELMVHKVPISAVPEGIIPKKGMILALNSPEGQQIPVPIVDVSETEITLDMNHPLAGKNLIFKIKILEVA
jgi:peptidylprolyl isomerase